MSVSFSGQGEKLLERNNHPDHNLMQYGIYIVNNDVVVYTYGVVKS